MLLRILFNHEDIILVNTIKRKSLKTIAGLGLGAVAAGTTPFAFATKRSKQLNSGINISHVKTVFGQTVFVENTTEKNVRMHSISPGYIDTDESRFDLNNLMTDGPLEINKGTTLAINVSEDGRIHNWATWDTLESPSKLEISSDSEYSVNVYAYAHSLKGSRKHNVHAAYFA